MSYQRKGIIDSAFVAGMEVEDLVAEMRFVEMELEFGCGDAFMAEHLLNGTKIGASFEKMSCK